MDICQIMHQAAPPADEARVASRCAPCAVVAMWTARTLWQCCAACAVCCRQAASGATVTRPARSTAAARSAAASACVGRASPGAGVTSASPTTTASAQRDVNVRRARFPLPYSFRQTFAEQ